MNKNIFYQIIAFFILINFISSCSSNNSKIIRVAAYNVEFGKNATPEQIGEMLKPYDLDLIGFNEVPAGDWTNRVGKMLGLNYSYTGKISSANHQDKFKSILSKTPLVETDEHFLNMGDGWNPASVVRAITKINGINLSFYSLHIAASELKQGHAFQLASEILSKDNSETIIIAGDFNNAIDDSAMKNFENIGFKSVWYELPIELSTKKTHNAFYPEQPGRVIDHILYKSNFSFKGNVKNGGIIELENPLSDHHPIWAEIIFFH